MSRFFYFSTFDFLLLLYWTKSLETYFEVLLLKKTLSWITFYYKHVVKPHLHASWSFKMLCSLKKKESRLFYEKLKLKVIILIDYSVFYCIVVIFLYVTNICLNRVNYFKSPLCEFILGEHFALFKICIKAVIFV